MVYVAVFLLFISFSFGQTTEPQYNVRQLKELVETMDEMKKELKEGQKNVTEKGKNLLKSISGTTSIVLRRSNGDLVRVGITEDGKYFSEYLSNEEVVDTSDGITFGVKLFEVEGKSLNAYVALFALIIYLTGTIYLAYSAYGTLRSGNFAGFLLEVVIWLISTGIALKVLQIGLLGK